ncbi:hypothetical protein DL98DRAFT_508799 [Cadophora sp. DSE1049]|nr:hypothetical protein DL98DRAFT_508799 [Cadophora sp. DSE1049]
MILDQLSKDESHSLLRLCLISKRFSQLASTVIYRSVTVPETTAWPSDSDLQAGSERYTFAANVMTSCQQIKVHNEFHWASFAALLCRMRRLESLRWQFWESPFPTEVSRTVQQF